MPEPKVLANRNNLGVETLDEIPLDELLWGQSHDLRIEIDERRRIQPHFREQLQPSPKCRQFGWCRRTAHNAVGVRREGHRNDFALLGCLVKRLEDGSMAAMNTVEDTDGNGATSGTVVPRGGIPAIHLHAMTTSGSRTSGVVRRYTASSSPVRAVTRTAPSMSGSSAWRSSDLPLRTRNSIASSTRTSGRTASAFDGGIRMRSMSPSAIACTASRTDTAASTSREPFRTRPERYEVRTPAERSCDVVGEGPDIRACRGRPSET